MTFSSLPKKQTLDHGLGVGSILARRSWLERVSYDIEKAHHPLTTNGVSVILFSTSQSPCGEGVSARHLECLCTKFSALYFLYSTLCDTLTTGHSYIRWVNLTG